MERREHFGKIVLTSAEPRRTRKERPMKRLGVDVGGTFTDLIYVDDEAGTVIVHKIPSTPADPSEGTVQGISELSAQAGEAPAALDQVFHGTTIATNIVIEHNGAEVGMITTEGYRDILHIARHKKPLNFSIYQDLPVAGVPDRPAPLPADRPRADHEATAPCSSRSTTTRCASRCASSRRPASRRSPSASSSRSSTRTHEQRVAEIVREEFPEAFLSVSSEVLPQYREYERFSTVCLNAYVGPKVARYVGRFEERAARLRGQDGHPPDDLRERRRDRRRAPSRGRSTCSCPGPVAGVVGGIWAGQAGRLRRTSSRSTSAARRPTSASRRTARCA